MRKIPPLDAPYWMLLISATVFGETFGDLLSQGLRLGYLLSTVIFFAAFAVAVGAQLFARSEHAALYWAVILTTSTTGTTISDFVTRSAGLGYPLGTLALAAALVMLFVVWKLGHHELREDGQVSRGTETLYWLGILVASTLGTCFGDLLSETVGLGFLGGTLLLAVLLAAVAILQRFAKGQRELFYWAAIVVVHPIGATTGDYLSKDEGLHLGPFSSSLLLGAFFAVVVVTTWLIGRRQRMRVSGDA